LVAPQGVFPDGGWDVAPIDFVVQEDVVRSGAEQRDEVADGGPLRRVVIALDEFALARHRDAALDEFSAQWRPPSVYPIRFPPREPE